MALSKPFVDECGNDYEQSYWRCVQINISAPDQRINLTFYGFKDAEAFSAGKQLLTGASKSYQITGDEFAAIAAATPIGSTLYDVLAHAAEAYALSKLDSPNGQGILVSFFDGATQV